MFISTLIRVATLLAYAVPGFIFIKAKAISQESIPAFAKVLVYVCSPCLSVYSFSKASYTPELNKTIWICFALAFGLILLFLTLFYLFLRTKGGDIRWRVFTIATALGNVGFFGVPLLEYFLSAYPQALVFSEIMSVSMNLVAWTVGLFILSGDKQFMRPQKILTVPSFIAMLIAYPMFLFGWEFPPVILDTISLLGRMSTPLCMLILGMRLATAKFKTLVTDWRSALAALIKLTGFPLAMFGAVTLLPIDPYVKAAMFLLACCPCASMVLSLSELFGKGQKSAANTVLIATLMSVITIPIMAQLLLPLIL